MPIKHESPYANRLLMSLPLDEKQAVLECSEIVNLFAGDVLCESGLIPRHVYFPVSSLISLGIDVDEQPPLELTMIGWDGMLGATRVLGVSESPMRGVVMCAGSAVRLTVRAFEELTREGMQFQAIVKRYLFVLMTQVSRTSGCTHFHEVSSRLARCLLMTHDRSSSDTFYMTQQFLSEILGVQRSAVSIAASALQQKGLINYSRGGITILDRAGLEGASCSCYTAISKDQLRFSSVLAPL